LTPVFLDPEALARLARGNAADPMPFARLLGRTPRPQPLSGWYLIQRMGLYALAMACWLPVVWLQMRLRDEAAAALHEGRALGPGYWRAFRCWVALGVPAFFAFLVIFYLMVAKRP